LQGLSECLYQIAELSGEITIRFIPDANDGDDIRIQTFKNVGEILEESLNDILKKQNIEYMLFKGQISNSIHRMEP
jgi:hypothetical protein